MIYEECIRDDLIVPTDLQLLVTEGQWEKQKDMEYFFW